MLQGIVRSTLKAETDALHRELDQSFEAFDLFSPDGYAAFLAAHKLAADQYQAPVNAFCEAELGRSLPDYSKMLAEDLAAMENALISPTDHETSQAADMGLTYVALGSRLGLASIAAKEGQRMEQAHPDSEHTFLRDRDGLVLWREFLAWDADQAMSETQLQCAIRQAKEGFAMFARAAEKMHVMMN